MSIKTKVFCLVLCAALSATYAVAQDTESEPIITFRTSIYEQHGDVNQFSLRLGTTESTYFDIDYGFGPEEIKVEPAYFDSETQSIKATSIQCRVNQDGIVRIYGDASKLDYFDAEGCYMEWIDMDACSNLTVIDLQHNALKRLDLTPFTKLQALYLSDNPFSPESPLIVGPGKPELAILEIDIIDYLDSSFNLSDYPAMVSFDAYHCRGLKTLDPTGCPELQVLSLELTDVSALDLSNNPKLLRLNISESRITSIDISHNPLLQHFLAEHVSGSINTGYRLGSVDLSSNPELAILTLAGNHLSDIDLSHNPLITNLNLKDNSLTAINLDANKSLYSVNLSYNNLDYATLPLPNPEWGEYYYFRNPLPCSRSYGVGAEIDFSSRVLRDGTVTTAKVWRAPVAAEPELLPEDAYTYSDGKIMFKAAQTDSVYVEFANNTFADYTLRSASFMVKDASQLGKPAKIVGLRVAGGPVAFGLAVDGAAETSPRTVHIAVGEGESRNFAVASSDPLVPTIVDLGDIASEQDIAISIEEGDVLIGLSIENTPIESIDLSAATELRYLKVSECSLRSIDLSNNRCLTTLDVSGNRISTLSLVAPIGSYDKNVLKNIDASDNQIYNFEIVSTPQVERLDLSGNRFTGIDLRNYDHLKYLNLSSNRIKGTLNLAYLGEAIEIDLHSNSIDSVTVVDMPALERFDLSDNNMTIKTMPVLSYADGVDYVYAPQKNLGITATAPGINISAQYRVINGAGTEFVWKKTDGTLLVEGVDMMCRNGATRFLDENLGTVYCEMSHPAFPDFSGDKVYKTTPTLVVGAPTNVIASFTTTEGVGDASVVFTGNKKTVVYIDWRGDGTEFIPYDVSDEAYTSYPGQVTYSDAEVKVYTYGNADELKVFSVYGVKMSGMDASPLTALESFSVGGASLDEETLVFPASPGLKELNLEGNNFSTKTFEEFAGLTNMSLNGNSYETFDVSKFPNIQTLVMSNNALTSISFANNDKLWGLDLGTNRFTTLSFEGAPAIEQLFVPNNVLEEIELSAIGNTLRVLDVSGNKFDMVTLPRQESLPRLSVYYYSGQAAVDAACVDGRVDLSSQAKVGETATEYLWYLGEVAVDPETGEVSGELLVTGEEDAEYTVENGITSFHYTFDDNVVCLMTNAEYPQLQLFTKPVTVDAVAGIESVVVDSEDALDPDALVDVFTVSGMCVRRSVRRAEALDGLVPGFYLVGGSKVCVSR